VASAARLWTSGYSQGRSESRRGVFVNTKRRRGSNAERGGCRYAEQGKNGAGVTGVGAKESTEFPDVAYERGGRNLKESRQNEGPVPPNRSRKLKKSVVPRKGRTRQDEGTEDIMVKPFEKGTRSP